MKAKAEGGLLGLSLQISTTSGALPSANYQIITCLDPSYWANGLGANNPVKGNPPYPKEKGLDDIKC